LPRSEVRKEAPPLSKPGGEKRDETLPLSKPGGEEMVLEGKCDLFRSLPLWHDHHLTAGVIGLLFWEHVAAGHSG